MRIRLTCFVLFCLTSIAGGNFVLGETVDVYIGTYTDGKSKGIYKATFDTESGELSEAELAGETDNPSFLAIHPDGNYLYAVNETADRRGLDKKPSGGVSSFRIEDDGKLTFINERASHGAAPCHLNTDAAGKFVYVANYNGGNVSVFEIEANGSLSQILQLIDHKGSSLNKRRQAAPHAHSINLDKSGKFAVAADLGIDTIAIYAIDSETGKLKTAGGARLKPGSGPRHFAFHPTKNFGYVINELKLTVTVFDYDPETGQLIDKQYVSTIPDEEPGPLKSTAEVQVHPSGKFLFGSNRGSNTIAVFLIDQKDGKLTHVENESTGGKTPRNFAIAPGGKYLLAENQGSNSIVVFKINQETGELDPTGDKIDVPSPVCIRFK